MTAPVSSDSSASLPLANFAAHNSDASLASKLEFYEAKGDVLYKQEDFEAAAQSYVQALELQPQARLHLKLAYALSRSHQRLASLKAQYQALQLDPAMASAAEVHRLGQALMEFAQVDLALDCYQQAIARDNPVEQYHLSLAAAWVDAGQSAAAEECYQQVLRLNPESATAHRFLGECCRDRGEPDAAAHHFLQILRQQPEHTEIYVWLRYSFLRYGLSATAEILQQVVEVCREILTRTPRVVQINSLLGYALTKQGKGEAAIAPYRAAVEQKTRILKPQIPEIAWASASDSAPSFIILGGFKCATTSLYNYITAHPQVFPSLEKELDFFDRDYSQGLDWYLAHFPALPQGPAHPAVFLTGEATPNYLYHPEAPERIHRHFPAMKLIVVLRNPVERALSHYYFLPQNDRALSAFERVVMREQGRLQAALEKNPTPDEALRRCPYLGNGLYALHLQRWLRFFPPEQLLILPMENLAMRPAETVKTSFDFLEIPNYRLSEYKHHKEGSYPVLSEKLQRTLNKFFVPHNEQLNRLLKSLNVLPMSWA